MAQRLLECNTLVEVVGESGSGGVRLASTNLYVLKVSRIRQQDLQDPACTCHKLQFAKCNALSMWAVAQRSIHSVAENALQSLGCTCHLLHRLGTGSCVELRCRRCWGNNMV